MPRKKTNVLESVEFAGGWRTASGIARALNERLKDIPPAVYGENLSTPDQFYRWHQTKNFYRKVGAVIDAHSSGERPPDYSAMHKDDRQAIMNEAWFYLSFYNLIFFNWDAVAESLRDKNNPVVELPSAKANKPIVKNFAELETPIEVALEVMRYRAVGFIASSFSEGRIEITPNSTRASINLSKKMETPDRPVALQRQYMDVVEDFLSKHPWHFLQNLCVHAVNCSSPNDAGKLARDNFHNCYKSGRALVAKSVHKRVKAKRIVWEGGVRIRGEDNE